MLLRRVLLLFVFLLVPICVWSYFSGFVFPMKTNSGISLYLGDSWSKYFGHLGEDFIDNPGAKVYSVADGEIVVSNNWALCDEFEVVNGKNIKIKNSHGWGGVVIIKHDLTDGNYFYTKESSFGHDYKDVSVVYSEYGHLTNINFEIGDKVKKGDLIGQIGNMCAWKPHLHFEIKNRDAFDSEILGGVGKGYSGTDGVAPNRFEPTKFIESNKDLIVGEPEPEQPPVKKSWWGKVKGFFSGDESDEVKTEDEQDIIGENEVGEDGQVEEDPVGTYSLSFLNSGQNIETKPGEQINLKVEVKNRGSADWKKENISLNVVGGLNANNEYYNSSWITKLRLAILDDDVLPGEIGNFTFDINTPQEVGEYNFKVQAVQVDNGFSYVEGGFWEVIINIFEENIENEVEENVETDLVLPQEEKSISDKIKEVVEEVVEDIKGVAEEVKKTVKRVIFGGGGSSSGGIVDPVEEEVVVIDLPEIIVTSHTTSTHYIATSTVLISGTKNDATEVVYVNTSTANIVSSTAWELNAELDEGENIFEIYGENSVGEETNTTTVSIYLDTISPSVPIVSVIQSEYATPTLYISWSAEDSGVGVFSYDVKYVFQETEVGLLNETTSTNYSLEADRLETYEFLVRARDSLGNISSWSTSTEILVDWPKDVVINEVAWMGVSSQKTPMKNCPQNEWMELYNNGDVEINLNGWYVLVDSKKINLQGIILPNDYFVLSRQVKTRVALVNPIPDSIWKDIEIPENGGRILLVDSSDNVIDEVNSPGGWFAGNNVGKYQSMSRIDTNKPGSFGDNWETWQYLRYGPHSSSCGTVFGTPGQINRGFWYLNNMTTNYIDVFDENNILNLTADNGPYIYGTELLIPSGYTLSAGPGSVFYAQSRDSYFKVSGQLDLNGTAEEPIIFTSALDINYVKENRSTLVGDPSPGDWSRIQIESGGILNTMQAKFLYGGKGYFQPGGFVFGGKFFSNIIFNNSGLVNLDNVEFNNNYTQTNEDHIQYNSIIWSERATTTISNSLLIGGSNIGAVVSGGFMLLDNTTFIDLNTGIEVKGTGQIEMQNMDENNFQSITNHNWFPIDIWTFPTST